ncbi:MAG: ferrous iron transport protein B [Deltaproteobacteria bacterium]|nr:ferrous iron transport protein B [Deltaproteobacteria bacterium]
MKKVLLIGLPNVGKSTIFSRLTSKKVKIDTVAGTTVEVKRGGLRAEGQEIEIIDTPGVNNLFFNADQEKVARNILIDETPDLVIQVADAKNLKRSLVLTSLLADIGLPLVLVLNMVDEAAQKGIKVKRHKLEDRLGAPVLETVASEGIGIPALFSALDKAVPPTYPSRLPSGLAEAVPRLAGLMADKVHPEWVRRALALFALSADKEIARWARQRSGISGHKEALNLIEDAERPFHRTVDLAILRANDFWAEALYEESVYFTPVTSTPVLNRLGDLALTPVTGLLILFALLASLYFIVGKFAAGFLVDFLVEDIFGDLLGVHLKYAVAMIPSAWVRDLIAGEYGLYPMALVPAFGLVLPVIVVFFFTFGFIEDSGYFSRLSILLDRLFRKIGLNGKAVMPLVLGFSCVTMATISTRVLDSRRERFIAIFLLSLGIPCSAKLSIILVILARVSLMAFLVVFGVVFTLTIASGFVLSRLMPGKSAPFIMEIPLIRIPSLMNVLTKTSYRSLMFIREALPLFLVSALALFLLEKIGLLALAERFSAPVIKGFLGLPPQFAESLIMGFLRGEAGIAVLKKLVDTGVMDHLQLVVAIIVTILFIPCVTSFMLIIKEQGTKKALAIIVSVTACAIMTGGLMNFFLRWINFSV